MMLYISHKERPNLTRDQHNPDQPKPDSKKKTLEREGKWIKPLLFLNNSLLKVSAYGLSPNNIKKKILKVPFNICCHYIQYDINYWSKIHQIILEVYKKKRVAKFWQCCDVMSSWTYMGSATDLCASLLDNPVCFFAVVVSVKQETNLFINPHYLRKRWTCMCSMCASEHTNRENNL